MGSCKRIKISMQIVVKRKKTQLVYRLFGYNHTGRNTVYQTGYATERTHVYTHTLTTTHAPPTQFPLPLSLSQLHRSHQESRTTWPLSWDRSFSVSFIECILRFIPFTLRATPRHPSLSRDTEPSPTPPHHYRSDLELLLPPPSSPYFLGTTIPFTTGDISYDITW